MVNIKKLRKELGYTQKEFAALLGVSQSGLSNLENGAYAPDGEVQSKLNELCKRVSSKTCAMRDFGFVRVGASTPKIKVADVAYNAKSIIAAISEAAKNSVKLLALPELVLTGYTCGDLFYSNTLTDGAVSAVLEVAEATAELDITAVVGCPLLVGGKLYNCAFVLNRGEILGIVPKTYLPNYNEFYEKRQFYPAPDERSEVIIAGKSYPFGTKLLFRCSSLPELTFGVEICEDLWGATPPSISHALNGATVMLNLSASNEVVGKAEYRRNLVTGQSARLVCAYVYADAGDGESTTDIVFAGHNLIAENGKLLKETELFNNGLVAADVDVKLLCSERQRLFNYGYPKDGDYRFIDFAAEGEYDTIRVFNKTPFVPTDSEELDDRAKLILDLQANALKKRIEHTRAKTAVVGVSGGLDSALALIVAVRAMKLCGRPATDVIGVTMPCFGTTGRTYNNSIKLMQELGISYRTVEIKAAVLQHFKDIDHSADKTDVTYENAQARERTQVLMDISNMTGGMVVGTGDLSELALGWATYNGDHMSMYGVNGSVPKTLVKYLVKYEAQRSGARLRETLLDILATPVSPELLPPDESDKIQQSTEDIVGPYILHDFFLYYFLRAGYSPKKLFYVACLTFKDEFSAEYIKKCLITFITRFFTQQFKRSCLPDGVKVGSVALSPRGDWRMPSDAAYALWLAELESCNA